MAWAYANKQAATKEQQAWRAGARQPATAAEPAVIALGRGRLPAASDCAYSRGSPRHQTPS